MDINNKIPERNPHYVLKQMDDEQLLYNPLQTKTIYLNPSAAIIWNLCNGKNTLGHIINILQESFPESSQQIAADVIQSIDELVSHQAIVLK